MEQVWKKSIINDCAEKANSPKIKKYIEDDVMRPYENGLKLYYLFKI